MNDNGSFERLMQFAKNHRPHDGLSNLYLFTLRDEDGNPIQEAYGMNQLTNYGFERFFDDRYSFQTNFYVSADNDETVNFQTDSAFELYEITNPATIIATCIQNDSFFNYPMWYDNDSGLISLMCKFMTCYYPTQVDGGTSRELTIYQHGIGNSVTQLWTRSWLYNLQGEKAMIKKFPNQRLDIEVYFVLTYNKTLITDGWNVGRYVAMTTMYRFLRQHMGYDDEYAYTYRRYNSMTNRGLSNRGITAGTNNDRTIYHVMSQFQLNSTNDAINGYIDGFIQRGLGYISFETQTQTNGEPINNLQVKAVWGDSLNKSKAYGNATGGCDIGASSISDMFGHVNYNDKTPFTQFNPTSCKMYSYLTGEYSITTDFRKDPAYQYTETSFHQDNSIDIFYTNSISGTITRCYLFINAHPELEITKFENGNIVIYATDEYWKRASWELIPDPSNVPITLRNKHFYINDIKTTLNPRRASSGFELIPETTERTYWNCGATWRYGQYQYCENSNTGYEYYVKSNRVCFVNTQRNYVISGISADRGKSRHFCYKNSIVSLTNSDNKYYFTNVTDRNAITTTAYSITDANNGYGINDTSMNTNTYASETTSGVLGFQHLNSNDPYFVVTYIEWELDNTAADITGHIARRFHFQSTMGCCIRDDTRNRIAYCYNGIIYIKEYDVATNTWNDVTTYALPSGNANPILMFAHKNHLWVYGESYILYYDLTAASGSTGVAVTGTKHFTTLSQAAYAVCDAIDEAIIVYRYNNPQINDIDLIEISNPTEIHALNYDDNTTDSRESVMYAKLKKLYNESLVLVCGYTVSRSVYWDGTYYGSTRAIIDIGKLLKPPIDGSSGVDISYNSDYRCADGGVKGRDGIYCYGDHYIIDEAGGVYTGDPNTVVTHSIPIEFAMTHELNGTTNTISAINSIRNVSGKQWSITVTNVKNRYYGDSGKPPGAQN